MNTQTTIPTQSNPNPPATFRARTLCPDCKMETNVREEHVEAHDVRFKSSRVTWEEYFTTEERCELCEKIHDTEATRERWMAKLTAAGFPKRHVEDVESYAGASIARARVIQPTLADGGVCVLYGDRGRGKTGIATWLAWQRVLDGKPVGKFLRAMQIFLRVRAAFAKDAKETEAKIVAELQATPFLVVDELHERSESEWENRVLTEIMNGRYECGLPTLLITNCEKAKLVASLGASVADRIRETGIFVNCDWTSYRKKFEMEEAK